MFIIIRLEARLQPNIGFTILDSAMYDLFVKMQDSDHCLHQLLFPVRSTTNCYMQQVFPWAHQSRLCKQHLDRFSRF